MSYCRLGWGGSQVYVFESVEGHIECCMCGLGEDFKGTRPRMVSHLMDHIKAGHNVPKDAINALIDEIYDNAPTAQE